VNKKYTKVGYGVSDNVFWVKIVLIKKGHG
jgi:hypothetical protein